MGGVGGFKSGDGSEIIVITIAIDVWIVVVVVVVLVVLYGSIVQ